MSDADKRQTRQRALTIVACAAVFALGGPLIAQRFGDQKAQEARAAAEEALKNAKSEIDIARAQSELAVMAAQIAALRKYRQKK